MDQGYIPRHTEDLLEQVLSDTPVVIVSGGRQVGKTTLLKNVMSRRDHLFVNLDDAPVRSAALADPDGFVQQYPQGTLVIDEIQRVPQLFLSMKSALEKERRPGRFAVTGSAKLTSVPGVEESLAGRAEIINLSGLSRGEIAGEKDDFAAFVWGLPRAHPHVELPVHTRGEYLEMVTKTAFPGLQGENENRINRWLRNYLEFIFAKDIPQLSKLQNPNRLPQLLNLLAAQNASEFVGSTYGRHMDIPGRSLSAYLELLKDVYLVRQIPAWSANVTKRMISRPKVIISDGAMAAHLCGVDAAGLEENISSSLAGGFFEAFVANELFKQQAWSEVDYQLFHFRDRQGREVDLVLENRRREIVGIETKAAVSISRSDFSALRFLQEKSGDRFQAGVVIYAGEHLLPFGKNLWAMPLSALWATGAHHA